MSSRLGFTPIAQIGAYWKPDPITDTTSWVQVSLIVPHRVTGVMVKGDPGSNQYVDTFSLQYSHDNRNWNTEGDGGIDKVCS